MGCQISHEKNSDIISVHTQQQFRLSYKELVSQDRGHVFDLYHFSNIINRSNYSIVRKVTSKASQQPRVCKIVPLVNKKYFTIISEVEYLKKLDHPNVIQIIQYFLQPSFLYIILEDIPGDRILSELNKIKSGILFEDFVDITTQLLRTIDFCHRKMIAHRAITIQNIMLFWNENKPLIKLIDFSQACAIGCATPLPFLLDKRNIVLNQSQINQTDKMDIYDCGIVIATLLQGRKIKSLDSVVDYSSILQKVTTVVKQIHLSKKIQNDLIDLLSMMLCQTPSQRPSAQQCLNHPFFKHFNKNISSKKALESLLSFKADNNLKYLLSMYASLNMTSAMDKAEYLTEFYNLDKNKDGEIQMQQLVQGIKNTFNMQQQKAKKYAEQMFSNLDKNKSGTLNFSQFVIGTIRLSRLISKDFLQKMFNQIDVNKDGYISETQLNNLMVGMDKKAFFDQRKQVNFREFKQIMIKLIEDDTKIGII